MARSRRGGGGATKIRKIGDWSKARKVMPGFAAFYKQAEISSLRKEAEFARGKVLKAFKTSGASNGKKWAPNSPLVASDKGSTKPLVNKGDLMGSITVIEVGPAAFFVGIPNNKRNRSGTKLARIGEVHEFGKVIVMQITQKQHRFFMAKMAKMGGGSGGGRGGGGGFRPGAVLVIKIPQRSFFGATEDAHFKGGKSQRRIKRRIAEEMRQRVGVLRGAV